MRKEIRIYIPTGLPSHLEAITEHIPNECEIQWNNLVYEDGHREGIIHFPNGESYSVDEF